MKFIFPQNYNFKNKLFGVIDYTTAIINILWFIFIIFISSIIFKNWNIRIFLIITFCFPLFLFSFVGFNNENILHVLSYLFSYIIKQKIYFYSKNYNKF